MNDKKEGPALRTKPGNLGDRLHGDDDVRRVCLLPGDISEGKIQESAFSFSSKELEDSNPTISVWEASLTTVEEAVSLTTNPKRRLVVTFGVDLVEEIEPLQCIWEPIESSKPGYLGHAGIRGMAENGRTVKALRRQLLKAVNENSEMSTVASEGT